jgi:hypothetical protein
MQQHSFLRKTCNAVRDLIILWRGQQRKNQCGISAIFNQPFCLTTKTQCKNITNNSEMEINEHEAGMKQVFWRWVLDYDTCFIKSLFGERKNDQWCPTSDQIEQGRWQQKTEKNTWDINHVCSLHHNVILERNSLQCDEMMNFTHRSMLLQQCCWGAEGGGWYTKGWCSG